MGEKFEKLSQKGKLEPVQERSKYTQEDFVAVKAEIRDLEDEYIGYLVDHDGEDTESEQIRKKLGEARRKLREIRLALKVQKEVDGETKSSKIHRVSDITEKSEKVSNEQYTLKDLKEAREELEIWKKRWENYSGNNPNKFQVDIKAAWHRVRRIEEFLKETGVLEMSEHEKLAAELDKQYPNAHHKTIVSYEGKKYQIRYFPIEKSRSGKTVTEWGHEWVPVKEESLK